MNDVRVLKADLAAKLEANRKAHVEAFAAVWAAFQKKAEAQAHDLYQQIIDARQGDHLRLSLSLVVPENHEDDYTRAIEMLEWEQGDIVVLQEHEFAQLVQDDWGWKRQFVTTGFAYMGDSSGLPGLQ